MSPHAAIETQALRKVYPAPAARRRSPAADDAAPEQPHRGSERAAPSASAGGAAGVVALHALDLTVRAGEFFGLLGPNGAGKTTTIGILTTRVRATSGTATVAGFSVAADEVRVRQRIGVVPQRPNPDRSLTTMENLVFHAAYFGYSFADATRRASELLATFELTGKRDVMVDALSGGQQQRLMIARALMHEPRVLFLDEPTVGLDPQARLALWTILRDLHASGRTIVMTTHYMDEADQLCERVAIVDRGRLLALDTPAALKSRAPGGTLIELTLDGPAHAAAEGARAVANVQRVEAADSVVRAYSDRGGQPIPALIDAVERTGRAVTNIHLGNPSLETLFISMTGRKLD